MKNHTNSISRTIFILLALGLAGCISIKPVSGSKFVILLVDTSNINDDTDPKAICSFPFQHGLSDANYKTHAFRGDRVTWMAFSTTSNTDVVEIDEIIFDEDPGTSGIAVTLAGVVSRNINLDAKRGKASYKIKFTVNGTNTFTLDPILRVH